MFKWFDYCEVISVYRIKLNEFSMGLLNYVDKFYDEFALAKLLHGIIINLLMGFAILLCFHYNIIYLERFN